MVSSRPLTWRIQSIPADFTKERLKSCFHSDDRKYIEVKSLVPDVTNYDADGTLTATILFSSREPREPRAEENYDFDIDKDFIGFTPLNNPDKDVYADIIAITGLAGHAFGSWAHSGQKMWLRDYLPRDIQNRARILIYGYESQLHGANTAKSIISDYGNSFIQSLMDLRDHPSCRDRPLILIGHSLGALIIKQAITDLEPSIRSRLPVRTLIFFGAPHNGLEVSALETLVKGHPTQTLISELKRESPTLTGLSERFRHVAKDMTIHTYYESRATSTVAQGPDGQWERRGEAKVMVERSSALLNFEAEKTRMKVDGDHKEIARLRRGQGGVYPNVLHIIKEALVSASDQFAAARAATAAETDAGDKWADEPDSNANDDQNTDEDTGDEGMGDFDDYNLICDNCYDEFPKTQTHKHCYICADGNYNLCRGCNADGTSCPGGHDMVSRELEHDSGDDDEEEGEEDDDDEIVGTCDFCGCGFIDDTSYFRCILCSDGEFFICIPCRKSGRICITGHKLSKPKIPRDTSSNGTAEETQEKINYCDLDGCECDLPRRPKPPSPKVNARKTEAEIEYCETAGCECSLPRRPKPPPPAVNTKETKAEIEYCDVAGCECSLPRRPKPAPPAVKAKGKKGDTKYCEVAGCECDLPRRPKPRRLW
ncbi:hypothetical protein VE01_00291 [Pseudogymnoascus verrucosus]|uniref:DUF676 domain-containing protein n=1 Tax=Pseudogymnoascus verrucosus TaxID=342668 RepID=A0A2P2SYF6_9PEZI|nr:uncharacterized protein VE01_00291 [Pseudogymnoascus verrucosus]OBU01305.1 hypothetical protein VE01_00291 [Pseudogymnoascus verrucosus]